MAIAKDYKIKIDLNWIVKKNKNSFELYSVLGEEIIIYAPKDHLAFDIIKYIYKDSKKISEIINCFNKKYQTSKILKKIKTLILDNIITIISNDTDNLTKSELERYKWQLEYLASYQNFSLTKYDIQRNWKNSKIMIIGLGGEGSIISWLLTSIGIGSITGIDGDKIKLSNLTRQLLYQHKDIGKFKVNIAKKTLISQNPNLHFTGIKKYISSFSEMKKYFYNQDLVILCADKPLIFLREWANKASIQTKVPYIAVSSNWIGPLCIPFKTACFECEQTYYRNKYGKDYNKFIRVLKETKEVPRPSFVFRPIISGTLIALQVAKYLSKSMPVEILKGKYMIDTSFNFTFQGVIRNKNCKICGDKLKS